ncbi:hypothetical protein [Cognatishimia maritima]|uniref:hypothetical protein n=1 Tax=Cognatishimia maritima TaxID=870908 RepID=UPI000934102E|nr:hypothetical protein [Cognatishimia maritima]
MTGLPGRADTDFFGKEASGWLFAFYPQIISISQFGFDCLWVSSLSSHISETNFVGYIDQVCHDFCMKMSSEAAKSLWAIKHPTSENPLIPVIFSVFLA